MKKQNILITGGSGLVGRHLTKRLLERGNRVAWLTRSPREDSFVRQFGWNPSTGEIDPEAIVFADSIIHLAGAGIADKRWSERRKRTIIESRVGSTNLLVKAIRNSDNPPQRVIAASAVGYYGADNGVRPYTETDPPGTDFLARTSKAWEKASQGFTDAGIPTVILRLGVVLAADGGALPRMASPVRLGLSAPLGDGRQIIPWIHIDDVTGMVESALENRLTPGIYNAVAPEVIDNRRLMRLLAGVLHRPMFMPAVPAFVLKAVLGELSLTVLGGAAVSAEKIRSQGYTFLYPQASGALQHLFSNGKKD